jgi:hypothetical protein
VAPPLAELAEGTGVRGRPDLSACSDGRGVHRSGARLTSPADMPLSVGEAAMKQRDVVIVGARLGGLSHEETAHEGWVDLP